MVIPINGESAIHEFSLPWIQGHRCFSAKVQYPEFSITLLSIRSKLRGLISEEFRLYTNGIGSDMNDLKLPLLGDYEEVMKNSRQNARQTISRNKKVFKSIFFCWKYEQSCTVFTVV